MKKIILALLAICIAAGITMRSSDPKVASVSAPAVKWLQSSISGISSTFMKETNPAKIGGNEGEVPPRVLTEGEAEGRANDLSRKAIMTEAERNELKALVASKTHIDASVSTLRTYSANDLEKNQKVRMDAGLFLLNALDAKGNPANQYVRQQIAELVLDPALEKIDDLKLKRSVVADRVELYLSLRKLYPQDADKITESASTDLHKRIITFANSLGNINKKGI